MSTVRTAAACGAISAAACVAVFAMLSKDQVEGPYDGGDLTIGIFGAPVVAALAAFLIHAVGRGPGRVAHTVAPFGVWLGTLFSIAAAGGERHKLETGAVWAAAAFLVHLAIAVRPRVVAGLALVAVVAAATGVTVAGQHRWRTQNFARVGVPSYVPEVPGFRLTGAYAGRGTVILALTGSTGSIDVYLHRRSGPAPCAPGDERRVVRGQYDTVSRLVFCLPGGGEMEMSPSVDGLLTSVRLVKVDPGFLASYPSRGTEREAD